MYLSGGNHNNVTDNEIYNNNHWGIVINGDNNIISGNTISVAPVSVGAPILSVGMYYGYGTPANGVLTTHNTIRGQADYIINTDSLPVGKTVDKIARIIEKHLVSN